MRRHRLLVLDYDRGRGGQAWGHDADRDYLRGGELWNFLGYPLDTVLWLNGLPVRRVSATAASLTSEAHRRFGVESLATVMLELDGGAHASIAVGRGPPPGNGTYTTAILGSHGYASVDELRPELEVVLADGSEAEELADGRLFELTFERVLDDMAAAVRGRGTLRRTLVDGCELAELIAAANESAATGEPRPIAGPAQLQSTSGKLSRNVRSSRRRSSPGRIECGGLIGPWERRKPEISPTACATAARPYPRASNSPSVRANALTRAWRVSAVSQSPPRQASRIRRLRGGLIGASHVYTPLAPRKRPATWASSWVK
jgi:hypothetical protein